MIQLTRLNDRPLVVKSDLIRFVEQAPDTVITLVNGDKIVVRESAQDVLDRVVQFRRAVLQGITPWSERCSALPPVVSSNAIAMSIATAMATPRIMAEIKINPRARNRSPVDKGIGGSGS